MLRIRIQALQRDDGIVYHMYFHFSRGTEVNDLPVVITPAKYLRADILHVPQNFILEFHRQEELPRGRTPGLTEDGECRGRMGGCL